jgi:hypothetical protein
MSEWRPTCWCPSCSSSGRPRPRFRRDRPPLTVGVRVSGRNAGEYRVNVSPDGLSYEKGGVASLPAVLEFDPGSLVLTTFGRLNAGTVTGDPAVADAFLNAFFRI